MLGMAPMLAQALVFALRLVWVFALRLAWVFALRRGRVSAPVSEAGVWA